MNKKKKRLKPLSFYGHKPEDVIRAFMQTDPQKIKEKEAERQKSKEKG